MNGAKTFSTMTDRFDRGQGPLYSFYKKLCGLQDQSGYPGEERHFLYLLGFEPRLVQLLA